MGAAGLGMRFSHRLSLPHQPPISEGETCDRLGPLRERASGDRGGGEKAASFAGFLTLQKVFFPESSCWKVFFFGGFGINYPCLS